jgi:hypothetical protein
MRAGTVSDDRIAEATKLLPVEKALSYSQQGLELSRGN